MFIKQQDGNYKGRIRENFIQDTLTLCLARIIDERQDWGNLNEITLHNPGSILLDLEYIQEENSSEYILHVSEYGTHISKKEDRNRIMDQDYYISEHKLIGIFLLRKEEEDWSVQEIHLDDLFNKIGEDK